MRILLDTLPCCGGSAAVTDFRSRIPWERSGASEQQFLDTVIASEAAPSRATREPTY